MASLPKLTQDEVERMQAPMELDLVAYYKLLQDEILRVIDENADKSVDDIIHEVGKII